ncbi:MAG: oligoribonuclease [Gammaproteobacteria bacterium]|nr:MAG: oligoribonuclease [Gammaproteobacteria bacterium]
MEKSADNLIWIDLEMTGLDRENDKIIEIATIVTDPQLKEMIEGPTIAIHQDESIMNNMDEWCTAQHKKSGLTKRVKESTFSEADAEKATIEFLEKYVPSGISPMCGNSIGQDRAFILRCMPDLGKFFHYRNIDVSTLKELAKRWAPDVYKGFTKESSHLAMDDIKDSIAELKYYREYMLKI